MNQLIFFSKELGSLVSLLLLFCEWDLNSIPKEFKAVSFLHKSRFAVYLGPKSSVFFHADQVISGQQSIHSCGFEELRFKKAI